MIGPSDWHGRALQTALTEQPSLSLDFYSFGVLLRKRDGDIVSEYPVDPAQVALALAAKVTYDTGLLNGATLFIRYEGVVCTIAEYRKPQQTGVYLDGSDAPLRIPLPGLILIRQTRENRDPTYLVYAVRKRPESLDWPLFHAPLPNVYSSAAICWGSVRTVSDAALAGTSLAEDWQILLGSPFGDHAVSNKSKRFPDDVRKHFIDLEKRHARVYPRGDLLPTRKMLGQVSGPAS